MNGVSVPSIDTDPMIRLEVTLRRVPVGTTPWGRRSEVFFDGTATSSHWDGTWDATGVDHITYSADGVARIDVHVVITGDGGDVVTYRGHGRGGPDGVLEGVTFETSSAPLAWLNETVAIGRAHVAGDRLSVDLYRLRP